jgi:hypothetical protein
LAIPGEGFLYLQISLDLYSLVGAQYTGLYPNRLGRKEVSAGSGLRQPQDKAYWTQL